MSKKSYNQGSFQLAFASIFARLLARFPSPGPFPVFRLVHRVTMRSIFRVSLFFLLALLLTSGQDHSQAKGSDNKTAQAHTGGAQNPTSQTQVGAPCESSNAGGEQTKADQKSLPWLTHGEWVMSGLTFIYVGLTAFYAWTSHKTLKALEGQGLHAKNEAEAHNAQFLQQLKVSQDGVMALMNAEQAILAVSNADWGFDMTKNYFGYRVMNSGKTAATIFAANGCLQIGDMPDVIPDVSIFFEPERPINELIVPPDNQTYDVCKHPLVPRVNMTEAERTGITTGTQFLWACGFYCYRDIFGRKFTRRYCYRWNTKSGEFHDAGPWEYRRLI